MFLDSVSSALQSIIHSYLVFISVVGLIMFPANYLYRGNLKQTKTVEAFMTLAGLLIAFGIPYITLTLSRVQSLAIIIIIPILVASLAIYLLNKKADRYESE